MNANTLGAVLAAAFAAIAVVYVVRQKMQTASPPTRYAGNVYPDEETARMFKDQERLFQAF